VLFEDERLSGWDTVLSDLASEIDLEGMETCSEILMKILTAIKKLNCEVIFHFVQITYCSMLHFHYAKGIYY